MVETKQTACKSTGGRKKYGQLAPRQRAPNQPDVWPIQPVEEPLEMILEEVPVPLETILPEPEANQPDAQAQVPTEEDEEEDPEMHYVWVNHEDSALSTVLVPIEQMPSDVRNGGTASGYVVGPKSASEGPGEPAEEEDPMEIEEEPEEQEELSYSIEQVIPAPRAYGLGGWISESSEGNTEGEEEEYFEESADDASIGENDSDAPPSLTAKSRIEERPYQAAHVPDLVHCFPAANHFAIRDELVLVGKQKQKLVDQNGDLKSELAMYEEHCRNMTKEKLWKGTMLLRESGIGSWWRTTGGCDNVLLGWKGSWFPLTLSTEGLVTTSVATAPLRMRILGCYLLSRF
jgi:hypothetical protein